MKLHRLHVAAVTLAALVLTLPAVAQDSMMMTSRYAVKGDGEVNTFIFDDASTIVIVDSQRQLSLAGDVVEIVDDRADRVAGVLITHPHPDHVGGINVLREAFGAPVFGSQATAHEVANDTQHYLATTHTYLPNDTSVEPPVIDVIIADGDVIHLGDFSFEVFELGPGESLNMTLYFEPSQNMLIAGDLFAVGRTPFLLDEHVYEWIEQLDWVTETFAPDVMIYPGHGEPGTVADLVPAQKAYLEDFVALVRVANKGRVINYAERQSIIEKMEVRYPDHPPVAPISDLLEQNIDAVARELNARGEY